MLQEFCVWSEVSFSFPCLVLSSASFPLVFFFSVVSWFKGASLTTPAFTRSISLFARWAFRSFLESTRRKNILLHWVLPVRTPSNLPGTKTTNYNSDQTLRISDHRNFSYFPSLLTNFISQKFLLFSFFFYPKGIIIFINQFFTFEMIFWI